MFDWAPYFGAFTASELWATALVGALGLAPIVIMRIAAFGARDAVRLVYEAIK